MSEDGFPSGLSGGLPYRSITPGEEARELREEPLPIIVTEDDTFLPTRIHQVDLEIAALAASLSVLQRTREHLLKRALGVQALEDENCQIQFKERQIRILNVALFRERFPQDFITVCDQQRKELMKRIDLIGTEVPLGLADKLAGKDAVTALCEIQIQRTPYVVRKEGS